MSLKLNDKELNALLDDVVLDLNKSFSSVKEKLSKAEDKKEETMEKSGLPVEKDDSFKGDSAPEESSPAAHETQSAAPEASESAPADEQAAPAQDPAQEQGAELTPENLEAEYAKLPPEELQMHVQASQAALAKLGGGDLAMDAGMPPAAPAAPQSPDASAPGPAMKSEKTVNSLSKSEVEANAKVKSLEEDLEALTKVVRALIETPVRKAITSISDLQKSEKEEKVSQSMSPNEFWSKLKEVSKRKDLKKSDKELIKDIYERNVQPEVAAKHLAKLFEE
jgi:hypothetical protein